MRALQHLGPAFLVLTALALPDPALQAEGWDGWHYGGDDDAYADWYEGRRDSDSGERADRQADLGDETTSGGYVYDPERGWIPEEAVDDDDDVDWLWVRENPWQDDVDEERLVPRLDRRHRRPFLDRRRRPGVRIEPGRFDGRGGGIPQDDGSARTGTRSGGGGIGGL